MKGKPMLTANKWGIYEHNKLLNVSFNSKNEAITYVQSKFKHLEDNNKASNYIFNDFIKTTIKEKLKSYKIKKIKVIIVLPIGTDKIEVY
jgi:hypothetical protein